MNVINLTGNDDEQPFTSAGRELTDEQALRLMCDQLDALIQAALNSRLALLDAGFTVHHGLCKEFDQIAGRLAAARTRVNDDLIRIIYASSPHL